jgi:quercetin dioxygenase-like cupin family protein
VQIDTARIGCGRQTSRQVQRLFELRSGSGGLLAHVTKNGALGSGRDQRIGNSVDPDPGSAPISTLLAGDSLKRVDAVCTGELAEAQGDHPTVRSHAHILTPATDMSLVALDCWVALSFEEPAKGAAMGPWGPDGFARAPGEGQRVADGEDWLEVFVRGSDSQGALGVFEFHHAPIPEMQPHAHLGFMKVAYVLEGEYSFRVGDAVFEGSPGAVVMVPRGSHHAFTTSTGGRLLFVCSPSGNEEMFLDLKDLGAEPDARSVAEVMPRHRTIHPPGEAAKPWRAGS